MSASSFAAGSLITVAADWLEACGFSRFAGRPFEVVRARQTFEGTFIEVWTPAGTPWTVWEERGVAPYVAPVAMVPQPCQLQQARHVKHVPSPAPSVDRPAMVTETADDRDAANLANAVAFTASIRAEGVNQTIDSLPTLIEAGATAMLMEIKSKNGRQANVYAVTARGAASLVPRTTWFPEVAKALQALENAGC